MMGACHWKDPGPKLVGYECDVFFVILVWITLLPNVGFLHGFNIKEFHFPFFFFKFPFSANYFEAFVFLFKCNYDNISWFQFRTCISPALAQLHLML